MMFHNVILSLGLTYDVAVEVATSVESLLWDAYAEAYPSSQVESPCLWFGFSFA